MDVIIYHEASEGIPCPDGIAAAWVTSKHLGSQRYNLLGASYNTELPDLSRYDHIYIVDFSFPKSFLDSLSECGKNITLVDHHVTAMELLGDISNFSKNVNVTFDMKECGATLAWLTFFPGLKMPAFLEYVKDRDLWTKKLPMTEEIHESISYSKSKLVKLRDLFELFDDISQLDQNQLINRFAEKGTDLLRPKRELILKAVDTMQYRNLPGTNNLIPTVILLEDKSWDRLASDICSSLYKKFPEELLVAVISFDEHKWSLRSDKDGNNTDVSIIAKSYGGGGHRNAAGFKV